MGKSELGKKREGMNDRRRRGKSGIGTFSSHFCIVKKKEKQREKERKRERDLLTRYKGGKKKEVDVLFRSTNAMFVYTCSFMQC